MFNEFDSIPEGNRAITTSSHVYLFPTHELLQLGSHHDKSRTIKQCERDDSSRRRHQNHKHRQRHTGLMPSSAYYKRPALGHHYCSDC